MPPSGSRVELTSAGKAFLDHARMALVQAEQPSKQRTRSTAGETDVCPWVHVGGRNRVCCPEVDRVLRDEFPASTSACRVTIPSVAKALMMRRLDAAFMRPEEPVGDLRYARVRTDRWFLFFRATTAWHRNRPSRRKRSRAKLFYLPSKAPCGAPCRSGVFQPGRHRSQAEHECTMSSMQYHIDHVDARVMMLPAYTKRYLPES